MKIIIKIKNHFKQYWHRKRHAFSTRFSRSKIEYALEFFGLAAWLGLIVSTRELNFIVISCVSMMFIARSFPVFKAFWKGDEEKRTFLKKRRVESNTCLREINVCLIDPTHATPEKIKEIRQKLLSCIIDTVRAYRNDLPGSKIYSNLLIPEGDNLIVAIRNDPGRADGTRYRKNELKCGDVLESKRPLVCENVQLLTSRDLTYKSFMAIPVLDYTKQECLAIITIDSTEVHHFDEIYESFDTLLSPYITTITTTFILESRFKQSGGDDA